jgi:hypothetical protein
MFYGCEVVLLRLFTGVTRVTRVMPLGLLTRLASVALLSRLASVANSCNYRC